MSFVLQLLILPWYIATFLGRNIFADLPWNIFATLTGDVSTLLPRKEVDNLNSNQYNSFILPWHIGTLFSRYILAFLARNRFTLLFWHRFALLLVDCSALLPGNISAALFHHCWTFLPWNLLATTLTLTSIAAGTAGEWWTGRTTSKVAGWARWPSINAWTRGTGTTGASIATSPP